MVEIRNLPESSPVSADELISRLGVQVGVDRLFFVPLSRLENRLLQEPWVRAVHIEKQPPQSIAIDVFLREPIAVLQGTGDSLQWVDSEGVVFGSVDPAGKGAEVALDLPMVSGLGGSKDQERVKEAVAFLSGWKTEMQGTSAKPLELSSLSYSAERGWRAWVSYRGVNRGTQESRFRLSVDLGRTLFGSTADSVRLGRIRSVLSYIRDKGISARHLFADTDKKIVVKLATGS